MSYARFWDSDVYIYPRLDGIFCCARCSISQASEYHCVTRSEMLQHIAEHRERGDFVVKYADERLREELEKHGETGWPDDN